jgi:hypothetical protein
MVSWPGQQRKGCHHAQQCGAIVLTLLCSNRRNASFPVSCHAKKVRDVRHAYCGCRVDRISRSQRRNPSQGVPTLLHLGGEIARIQKQRPLPKCFRLWRYLGPQGPNRLDSVHLLRTSPRRKSNDQAHRHGCVVDRYDNEPNTRFISAQAWSQGHAWGTFSGGSGQIRGTSSGGAQVFGKSPIEETNTVLPPRAVFGRPFADHPATDGSPCFNPWDPATEPFSR